MGLQYEYFWAINPRIYEKYREAYVEKTRRELRQHDMLNHLLGRYISYGVNDPKRYPKQPFLAEAKTRPMTDEEMEAAAKRMTIRMGGTVKT